LKDACQEAQKGAKMNMKKLKICHIGPSINDKGGISTVIKLLLDSPLNQRVETMALPSVSSHMMLLTFISCLIKLKQLCKSKSVDIVHIHMSTKGSFFRKSLIAGICHNHCVPYIIHLHGGRFKEFYASLSEKKRNKCKRVFSGASRVIALSDSWKDFLSSFIDEELITVIFNSVDVNIEMPRTVLGEPAQMIFAGRMGEQKGIWDLLEVVRQLDGEGRCFKLVLLGDGEVERVREYIRDKNLDEKVLCLGWKEGREKEELFLQSDIFVLPSYAEGLPMAMLEAMAIGLIPVVTTVGGIPEVIEDGYNGYLFSPNDKQKLKDILVAIIGGSEENVQIRERAYLTVRERFNIEKVCDKLYEMYREIAK